MSVVSKACNPAVGTMPFVNQGLSYNAACDLHHSRVGCCCNDFNIVAENRAALMADVYLPLACSGSARPLCSPLCCYSMTCRGFMRLIALMWRLLILLSIVAGGPACSRTGKIHARPVVCIVGSTVQKEDSFIQAMRSNAIAKLSSRLSLDLCAWLSCLFIRLAGCRSLGRPGPRVTILVSDDGAWCSAKKVRASPKGA